MKVMQNRQGGFSLITAIFLLVVLAGLGAMMTTFFTLQQQSSALDVLGSRAYQAARAGIEWGAFQITHSGVVGGTFATNCSPGPTSSSILLNGTLSPFSLSVSCGATSHVEGADTLWVYNITATASGVNGAIPGGTDYVERVMQATIASGVGGDPASGIVYQREVY
jgi:MSHA biogenesis protein MshP